MKASVIGLATAFLAAALAVTVAVSTSASDPATGWPMNGAPHQQLESDRMMTQLMGTYVGPGMQGMMMSNGMSQRSSSPSYLRMLEQHVADMDRMLAREP